MAPTVIIAKIFRIVLTTAILFITVIANAQSVAINNNGAAANNSAMLDVSSTSKGMLIPRMTSAQRAVIASPAEGLIVFDTDTRGFWYYTNSAWNEIPKTVNGGGGAFSLPYAGSASFAGKVFSITNTNTSGGATALHGKSDVGSGVNPAFTMGAWGDNSTGAGVVGTSNTGIGAYGFSFQNYGVYGYTTNNSFSGVYGTHAGNGYGVKGEVSGTGAGVYGKNSTGSGISPGVSIGVWGDNSTGAGVVGTSNSNVGTYGYSINNHGSYGFTSGLNAAGIYGTRINNGPAIWGDIYADGIGMYGKSNGALGKAAFFENGNTSNTDTVAKFVHKGTGVNSYFINDGSSNTGALINGEHFGKGNGIYMKLWNAQNNSAGIYLYQYGNGSGIYAGSNKSKSAQFYSNAGNNDTTVHINSDGNGTGLQVNLNYSLNTKDALNVTTLGSGNAGEFVINNAANSEAGIKITTNGTGRGLHASLSNASNNAAAVYGSSSGSKGVEGIGQNYGVTGQSTSFTDGIGVFGQSHLNSANGIGVKGISYSTNSTSGAITGINNSSGIAVYAESATGTAVYATTSKISGAAIYGFNDAQQGQAVRGSAAGLDGVGIYGEAGNSTTNSYAGFFRTSNSANTKDVVQIYNQGAGRGLFIDQVNSSNTNEALEIRNSGTGNFLSLINGLNDTKVSIEKSGNIITDGTLVVKGNKGIVRNSNGNQLRVEVLTINIPAYTYSHYDSDWGPGGQFVTVNFSTPFLSPPVVYKANNSSGALLSGLSVEFYEVTTTGCTLLITNWGPYDLERNAGVYKAVAMGNE